MLATGAIQVSRDVFGNSDSFCDRCGSPNGFPCSDCGFGMAGLGIVREHAVVAEAKPLTDVEKRVMRREAEEAERRRDERDELKEHYL